MKVLQLIKDAKKYVADVVNGETIEVIGNNRVIIENANKILEYKQECIRLNVGKRIVKISGGHLKMNDYTDKNIVINGIITDIVFE